MKELGYTREELDACTIPVNSVEIAESMSIETIMEFCDDTGVTLNINDGKIVGINFGR